MNIFKKIREIICEQGVLPDDKNFHDYKKRKEISKQIPDAFVDNNGIPTYATKRDNGTISLSKLKKSLSCAKSNYTKTRNKKYETIIRDLEQKIEDVIGKTHVTPRTYNPTQSGIHDVLTNYKNIEDEQ